MRSSHEPGSGERDAVRNADHSDSADLTESERRLARECWAMLTMLEDRGLIHQVTYVWALRDALIAQDKSGLVEAALEYVNLLDYEKEHGHDYGSYRGVEGCVEGIRAALAAVPLADELTARRKQPWRPPNRRR